MSWDCPKKAQRFDFGWHPRRKEIDYSNIFFSFMFVWRMKKLKQKEIDYLFFSFMFVWRMKKIKATINGRDFLTKL